MVNSCIFSFKLFGMTIENHDRAKRTQTAEPFMRSKLWIILEVLRLKKKLLKDQA